jgi:hypothetical protein
LIVSAVSRKGLPDGKRHQHVLARFHQRVQLRKVPDNPIRHAGQRLVLVFLPQLVVLELEKRYIREGDHGAVRPAVAPTRRDVPLDGIETLGAALQQRVGWQRKI